MDAMDDEDANAQPEEHPQETANFPEVITETVTAMATGIPPQVQRNLFKALGRVFLAGAEWPAKALEGRARGASARANVEVARLEAEVSDIKARQKAREVIYRDSAKAAAALFKDPEQALRALDFHAADVVRDQSVREDVVLIAAEELKSDPPPADSVTEIDDDWLYSFFREASKRSKEEYKQLFGRILAGEIKAPGSFSIGTVEALARLNTRTAEIFQAACNVSTLGLGGIRLVSEPFASPGNNGLAPYGLTYDALARLIEEGLLRSEFSEHSTMKSIVLEGGIKLDNAGQEIFIVRRRAGNEPKNTSDIQFGGPSFTVAGAELRRVVTMKPSEEYIQALAKWLATQQLDLYRNLRTLGTALQGEKVEVAP